MLFFLVWKQSFLNQRFSQRSVRNARVELSCCLGYWRLDLVIEFGSVERGVVGEESEIK